MWPQRAPQKVETDGSKVRDNGPEMTITFHYPQAYPLLNDISAILVVMVNALIYNGGCIGHGRLNADL